MIFVAAELLILLAPRLARAIYITGYYFILPFSPMSGRLILLLYQEKKELSWWWRWCCSRTWYLQQKEVERVLDLAPMIPRSLSRTLFQVYSPEATDDRFPIRRCKYLALFIYIPLYRTLDIEKLCTVAYGR